MFFSTLDSLKNLLGWHATRSLHWVKCRVSLCWSSPGTSWRVSWWNWSRNSLGKRASHLDSDHTNLWKCVGKQCWSISWYVVVNYRMILLLQLPKFRNIKLHRCIFSKHFLRNLMDQTKSMSQHISNPKFSNQIEKKRKVWAFYGILPNAFGSLAFVSLPEGLSRPPKSNNKPYLGKEPMRIRNREWTILWLQLWGLHREFQGLKQNEMSRRISHNHKEATSLKCVQTEDKEGCFFLKRRRWLRIRGLSHCEA